MTPASSRIRAYWARRSLIYAGLAVVVLVLCFRATIGGDGVGYYSYLPSVVAHGSLDVGPVFDRFIAANTPVARQFLEITLPSGLTANYKPIGAALLALPFYLVTHVLFLIVPGHQSPDISTEYQLAFTAASLLYAILAIALLYRFLSEGFGKRIALLATLSVVFATPLVAYVVFAPSYSHTFSVFSITAFALYLYRTRNQRTRHQWFLAGLLGGLATVTHVQEGLFLGLVVAEAAWQLRHGRWSNRLLSGYAALGAGVALPIVPQLIVDQVLFQKWLPQPAPNISFDLAQPHIVELLFSTHHGWLSWSPLVAVAFVGIPAVVRRFQWFGAGLLAIGLGEFLINASLSDWWGGNGFGARRMTDQTLLIALGFAAVWAWCLERRLVRLTQTAVGAGILWTVLLLAQYYYLIRLDIGPPWPQFLLGQLQAIPYVPRLFIQGTVLREAARGSWLLALYATLVIAAVVIGGVGLATSLRSLTRGRPAGTRRRAPAC